MRTSLTRFLLWLFGSEKTELHFQLHVCRASALWKWKSSLVGRECQQQLQQPRGGRSSATFLQTRTKTCSEIWRNQTAGGKLLRMLLLFRRWAKRNTKHWSHKEFLIKSLRVFNLIRTKWRTTRDSRQIYVRLKVKNVLKADWKRRESWELRFDLIRIQDTTIPLENDSIMKQSIKLRNDSVEWSN